jgi:hypothetical protein
VKGAAKCKNGPKKRRPPLSREGQKRYKTKNCYNAEGSIDEDTSVENMNQDQCD